MRSHHKSYYVVNGITLYRFVSSPFLILLAINDHFDLFKWLLVLSFLTDAIDGFLARKYNVSSLFGARLDSIADDATIIAATISLFIYRPEFISEQWILILGMVTLLTIQNLAALISYSKVTSFHTTLAKTAAVLQGFFFMMIFFEIGPAQFTFYLVVGVTSLQLIEEIILVFILPEWKANVKGLLWVLRHRKRTFHT